MTGGQVALPVTIRLSNGAGAGFACQHSQTVENWFLNCPGLKIVAPGSIADAYGLFRAAVRDDDPVLYFEHKGMYNLKGELPDEPEALPIGKAAIVRPGEHATVVATQLMRHRAAQAADALAQDGIEVELIDPRTLLPLDVETIGESLDRTHRLVIVQESPLSGSWGATVVAAVVRDRFESLDAAPVMISGPETPVPYAGPLEDAWLPSRERIAAEIRSLVQS
jgi:pyruvate dehydrogenase E1 component beta subunit